MNDHYSNIICSPIYYDYSNQKTTPASYYFLLSSAFSSSNNLFTFPYVISGIFESPQMSEEDTILTPLQSTMALDAKVCAYFKSKNWCVYCGWARHRKCFQLFYKDCQYHISVKWPKPYRWLLLHDPDISVWYDYISCKIHSEFAGYQNFNHFVCQNLGPWKYVSKVTRNMVKCNQKLVVTWSLFPFKIIACMLFKFFPVISFSPWILAHPWTTTIATF